MIRGVCVFSATLTLLTCGVSIFGAEARAAPPAIPSAGQTTWTHCETQNFQIWTPFDQAAADWLGRHCEALRARISRRWLGPAKRADWVPRCELVVHPSARAYESALGRGAARSNGATSFALQSGRRPLRRIDLRGDAGDWLESVLPHEMTHLIVIDHLEGKALPRWADEGMAVLAESHDTHIRRAVWTAHSERRYSARELMTLGGNVYPEHARSAAFYEQSAVLVDLLSTLAPPERFIEFIKEGEQRGYEDALFESYGISNWTQLEARYQAHFVDWRKSSAALIRGRRTW